MSAIERVLESISISNREALSISNLREGLRISNREGLREALSISNREGLSISLQDMPALRNKLKKDTHLLSPNLVLTQLLGELIFAIVF